MWSLWCRVNMINLPNDNNTATPATAIQRQKNSKPCWLKNSYIGLSNFYSTNRTIILSVIALSCLHCKNSMIWNFPVGPLNDFLFSFIEMCCCFDSFYSSIEWLEFVFKRRPKYFKNSRQKLLSCKKPRKIAFIESVTFL